MTNKIDSLIDELDRLGKSRDDAWQVPREEVEILRQIALAHNAKTIVEVGTSYGFSGLFWASALRITGGKLHTIDRDLKKCVGSHVLEVGKTVLLERKKVFALADKYEIAVVGFE